VFYLEDVLAVDVGERISVRVPRERRAQRAASRHHRVCHREHPQGTFKCRPNPRNHRDLDLEVDYKFEGKLMSASRVQPFRLR